MKLHDFKIGMLFTCGDNGNIWRCVDIGSSNIIAQKTQTILTTYNPLTKEESTDLVTEADTPDYYGFVNKEVFDENDFPVCKAHN